MVVYLNGDFVDETRAAISVFDRGLLFGDGLFESMRAVEGIVFRLDRHLMRLRRAADLIGIAPPENAALAGAAREVLRRNRLVDARLRMTLTRGPGRPGDYVHAPGPPTVVLSATPYAGPDPALAASGVAVTLSRRAVPPAVLDPAIKSIGRLAMVLARREAQAHGAYEAILVDASERLTEGTASNLFLVAGGRLLTPPGPAQALPGITRQAVMEIAAAAGRPVREEPIDVAALEAADEVFLTNCSWEVLPVVSAGGRVIGGGRRGAITAELQERYRDLLRRECGRG